MTEKAGIRSDVRRGALVVGFGALAYMAGDLFDVLGLVENLYDFQGAGARVDALDAKQTAWDISHVLMGVGHIIAAVGFWLLGRSLASASNDRRSQVTATVVGWAGLATAAWAVNSYFAIVRTSEEVVAALEDPKAEMIVTGAIYLIGAIVLFVALGMTLLRLRHQRWLGWVLIVVGPPATLTIIGVGPSLPNALMLLLGLAISIHPYLSPNRASNPVSARP